MSVGNWITIAAVFVATSGSLIGAWVAIRVTVATLQADLENLRQNDLKHLRQNVVRLFERLDNYPCGAHEARLESICARLERFEKRLNETTNKA